MILLTLFDFTYKLEAPFGGNTEVTSLPDYISKIYIFAMGAVGIAALYALVLGGVQYVTSSVVDQKADAKDRIIKALIGLAVALGSYLILYTINPDLVSLRLNL